MTHIHCADCEAEQEEPLTLCECGALVCDDCFNTYHFNCDKEKE